MRRGWEIWTKASVSCEISGRFCYHGGRGVRGFSWKRLCLCGQLVTRKGLKPALCRIWRYLNFNIFNTYTGFRLWIYKCITAKFVVSRRVYCKPWVFCSVNHFSEGGVNANHNVTCSPSLTENDSRMFKNSEENRDGEWIFCRRKEAEGCFILVSDKSKKDQKNLRRKLNSSIVARNRTITKQRTLKHETNKSFRNPPITNHKAWPFELVQVITCFLRCPLRWWWNRKTQNSFEVWKTHSAIQRISL